MASLGCALSASRAAACWAIARVSACNRLSLSISSRIGHPLQIGEPLFQGGNGDGGRDGTRRIRIVGGEALDEFGRRQGRNVPVRLAWVQAPLAHHPADRAGISALETADRAAQADLPWQALAAEGRVELIDPWPRFCDGTRCSAVVDGVGQFFDNNHVTNAAALRVRDLFAPLFEGLAAEAAQTGATEG